MNPPQQFIVDARLLESGFSCVLQLPTGSGKTWLAKRAIRLVLQRGQRAIYLSPLRALAEELLPTWQDEFAPHGVGIFTGDYGNKKRLPVPFGDARVMIMTPERLDAITRAWQSHWHWIPQVDLVVVDEVHLLGEARRGARLEGAISRFRRLNPFCRFLCLSATLGNREELAEWLGGVDYGSEWRPVTLEWRIVRFRKADEKPGFLAAEVARTRNSGGKSLVFVQSRRRSEILSTYLSAQGLRADYHHAGLTHAVRRKAESSFRNAELDVLVATGTLEMGINMPVRQVVLYDTQFFDGSRFTPLSVNTIWQRAGRAGRPGLDESGEAVVFAPSWDKAAVDYPRGRFERIHSPLRNPSALTEQIIAEIGSGLSRSGGQLRRSFRTSLAGFQRCSLPIKETVRTMLRSGMICHSGNSGESDEQNSRLVPTPLGRVAARQLLHPETVLLMRRFFEEQHSFTGFDLLFVLSVTPDCEPIIPVDFEELGELAMRLNGIPSYLMQDLPKARLLLQGLGGKRVLAALKTAAVVLSWCSEGSSEKVASIYGIYPFEVNRLKESLERLLLAAASIKRILDEESTDESMGSESHDSRDRAIDLLGAMVSAGIPQASAELTLIDGVGPTWAQKLRNRGYSDLGAVARASRQALAAMPGLSPKRAESWISQATALQKQEHDSLEDTPRIQCLTQPCRARTSDPYRLRRSLELTVSRMSDDFCVVTGGLEPHVVKKENGSWLCDCRDHAAGNQCKHILAVMRSSRIDGESNPPETSQEGSSTGPMIDLQALWMER